MIGYQITTLGQSGTLTPITLPDPAPDQVLVQIAACGLNFADLLMIQGKYQERPSLPFIPGLELSGTVVACGSDVTHPKPGDRVAVFAGLGGLATHGLFDASRCLVLPDTVSFETAAAFQIAYGTSHLALGHKAQLQPGETLLVLGAAGGVGLTAVEIGHQMGARVIACARGVDKQAIARAAGADITFDSEDPELAAKLKSLGGVDVTYDAVGGDAFMAALRATRPEGRLLAIGFASGQVPQVPANLLLVKNISVLGLYWGGYLSFRPKILTDSLATLLGWIDLGKLKPHISHVLPLSETDTALDLLRNRHATGKVVVRMP